MLKAIVLLAFLLWLVPLRAAVSFVPESFVVDFQQIQKSSLTGSERKSNGVLKYKNPGMLYFHVQSPDEVIFVTNNKKTWYYTAPFIEGEEGELSVQDSHKNVLTSFFSSLSHGLKDNDNYTVADLTSNQVKISFKEKLKNDLNVVSALFQFKASKKEFSEISSILIEQEDGTKLTLDFKSVQTQVKLENEVFNFKAPPKTKIIE